MHGIPRVPWEAEGTFDGISTYRLDQTGKIYEHFVDNVLLRDPPMALNPLSGLNLVPMQPQISNGPTVGEQRAPCGTGGASGAGRAGDNWAGRIACLYALTRTPPFAPCRQLVHR